MARRTTYTDGKINIAIENQKLFDKTTPFWVYYNGKLASKWATKEAARAYMQVLLNY